MLKLFIAATLAAVCTTTIIDTQIASATEADNQAVHIGISDSLSATTPDSIASDNSHTISVLIAASIVLLLIKNQSQALSKNRTSKDLQSKLLNRLDRDVANRLISNAKRSNPGHSEQWYWEKVIYDLNRDRR